MSMRKTEKWLLVQWDECDSREVVNANDVNPPGDAKVGCVVHILRVCDNGQQHLKKATIIGSSRDRVLLEDQISPVKLYEDPIAGPSGYGALQQQKELEFPTSDTEWAPSNSSSEESEDEIKNKKAKLEKFSRSYTKNSSRVMRPCSRVPALNTSVNIRTRKVASNTENNNNRVYRKSVADSTNILPAAKTFVKIDAQDILNMRNSFDDIAALINEMRKCFPGKQDEKFTFPQLKSDREIILDNADLNESFDGNRSDISNRSEDNVLITNKYDIINGTPNNPNKIPLLSQQNRKSEKNGWIRIGSGQTLIHEDQYNKINFCTYSKATRTLLRAFFSRRTLATHTLTGKSSPAFKNRPVKTCLDPKIVADIIIEVSNRFNIRESFVRSIITTTCADEARMLRDKQLKMAAQNEKKKRRGRKRNNENIRKVNIEVRRKIKRSKSVEDQENVPPELNRNDNTK